MSNRARKQTEQSGPKITNLVTDKTMAGAIPKRSGVQKTLECPVCLSQFNTEDRIPRVLPCYHTLCASCVSSLVKDNIVTCPKCRKETKAEDVGTNFMLTDVLDALCEECVSHDRETKCTHCGQQLCSTCLDNHKQMISETLQVDLDALSSELSEFFSDSCAQRKRSNTERDALLSQIKSTFAAHRKTLDEYEGKLITQVMEIHDEVQLSVNSTNLDSKVTKFKTFIEQNCEKYEDALSKKSLSELCDFQAECSVLLSQLKQVKSADLKIIPLSFVVDNLALDQIHNDLGRLVSISDLSGSQFVQTQNAEASALPTRENETEDLGETAQEIAEETSTVQAVKTDPKSSPVTTGPKGTSLSAINYKVAQFDCSWGRKGHGRGQFNEPWGIVHSTDGQIIVSDFLGHRLQIFDKNLQFVRMFGHKGSGPNQFCHPTGIAINSPNEIFVSDCDNDRIQVCSMNGRFLHRFGVCGHKNGQLDGPSGIDYHNGHVYICDSGNFRIQVFTENGSYVNKFGPDRNYNKLFNNEPFSVKVTSSKKVLVGEREGGEGIHVFSLTGDYLAVFPTKCPNWLKPVTPRGITVDAQGYIIITDSENVVRVFSDRGEFMWEIRSKYDRLVNPHGITTDNDGNILVCDLVNHRIVRFSV